MKTEWDWRAEGKTHALRRLPPGAPLVVEVDYGPLIRRYVRDAIVAAVFIIGLLAIAAWR